MATESTLAQRKNKAPIVEGFEALYRKPLPSVRTGVSLLDVCAKTANKFETPELISSYFFSQADQAGDRLARGVVETPGFITDFIVRLAAETYFSKPLADLNLCHLSDIRWHDPCVGAGAFPLAILRAYRKALGHPFAAISQLPIIDINDISESAVFLTLCAIEAHIRNTGISIHDYVNSKRLTFSVSDELLRQGEGGDLFAGATGRFDIVVGNPPYVRSSRMSQEYRNCLKKRFFSTYHGSADLYTYFIASGISSLDTSGVLAFISPAGFTRAYSGRQIRKYITETSTLCSFVDMDENQVFSGANVHAAIYALKKDVRSPRHISYGHAVNNMDIEEIQRDTFALTLASADLSDRHGWSFYASSSEHRRFDLQFSQCLPLSNFGIKVYSGIRPGLTSAFILTEKEANAFPAGLRAKWLRRIILPSDIVRWEGAKSTHYLIFTPSDCEPPPDDLIGHLLKFKVQLSRRPEVRSPDDWYKLRACSYYAKMAEKKIVFPDLSAMQRFSLANGKAFVIDGSYFIDSANLALLGILNSNLAREYFTNRCSSVGSLKSKGRFRFKKTFVQEFPLPIWFSKPSALRQRLTEVVNEIIKLGESESRMGFLNELVTEFYKTPHE